MSMLKLEARVARAQAGCTLGDVDRETQLHGLAAVLGFVSNTGIAGPTLGGGFGYLSRKYGWTCDNLRAIELVINIAAARDAGQDRTLQAYGANYERLRALKRAWDPDNFFRSNKNIAP